jgi:hypothetical protein
VEGVKRPTTGREAAMAGPGRRLWGGGGAIVSVDRRTLIFDGLDPYIHPPADRAHPMDEIAALIDRIVRERFKDVNIDRVTVVRDTDHEDDDIFRVMVVFDQRGPLDAHKSAGLARHLRHALLERKERAFPIVSFVSRSDAKRLAPEAA